MPNLGLWDISYLWLPFTLWECPYFQEPLTDTARKNLVDIPLKKRRYLIFTKKKLLFGGVIFKGNFRIVLHSLAFDFKWSPKKCLFCFVFLPLWLCSISCQQQLMSSLCCLFFQRHVMLVKWCVYMKLLFPPTTHKYAPVGTAGSRAGLLSVWFGNQASCIQIPALSPMWVVGNYFSDAYVHFHVWENCVGGCYND